MGAYPRLQKQLRRKQYESVPVPMALGHAAELITHAYIQTSNRIGETRCAHQPCCARRCWRALLYVAVVQGTAQLGMRVWIPPPRPGQQLRKSARGEGGGAPTPSGCAAQFSAE